MELKKTVDLMEKKFKMSFWDIVRREGICITNQNIDWLIERVCRDLRMGIYQEISRLIDEEFDIVDYAIDKNPGVKIKIVCKMQERLKECFDNEIEHKSIYTERQVLFSIDQIAKEMLEGKA